MPTGMDRSKTSLERAFELAASGTVSQVHQIRTLLKREGYDQRQLKGPAINKQLREIIGQAKANTNRT
jgi:hypothetical protein